MVVLVKKTDTVDGGITHAQTSGNLSDENVVLQSTQNPYYQYFCGMNDYCSQLPCDPTELVSFTQTYRARRD